MPTVLTPHSGRGRPPARPRPRAEVEADRLACARELAAPLGRRRGAEGARRRSPPRPRATPIVNARRIAGARHRRHGRRAHRDARRLPLQGHGAAGGRSVRAVAVHARAGELADRGDGTIASDVLEALPRGAGREPPVSAERAVARIDLGAVRHNAARAGRARPAGARLMAVVKADGYGHGAVRRRPRGAGGRRVAPRAWPPSARPRSCARRASTAPLLVMGPLTRRRVGARGRRRGRRSPPGRPRPSSAPGRRSPAAGPPRGVHLKLDTGMGRLGARPEDVAALVEAAAAAGDGVVRGRPDDPLRDRRRARRARTPRFMNEQLLRFRAAVADLRAALPRGPGPRGQLGRHPARAARGLRHGALRHRALRVLALRRRPARRTTCARRCRWSSYLASVKTLRSRESVGYGRVWRAARGTRDRPGAGGLRRRLRARRSPAGAEVLVGGRRVPVVGHDLDGPADRRSRARGPRGAWGRRSC